MINKIHPNVVNSFRQQVNKAICTVMILLSFFNKVALQTSYSFNDLAIALTKMIQASMQLLSFSISIIAFSLRAQNGNTACSIGPSLEVCIYKSRSRIHSKSQSIFNNIIFTITAYFCIHLNQKLNPSAHAQFGPFSTGKYKCLIQFNNCCYLCYQAE